ncbi:MAG: hypothetical protein R8L53_09330 [Mariprofundales bacterium]
MSDYYDLPPVSESIAGRFTDLIISLQADEDLLGSFDVSNRLFNHYQTRRNGRFNI